MGASFLSIATAVPEHRLDAAEAVDRLASFWARVGKLDDGVAALGTRYTCEPVAQLLAPRTLGERNRAYARHARKLAGQAAAEALKRADVAAHAIDLVIAVSCTGYAVPSLDVPLIGDLGLRPDVLRLPITELGCSGGAAGIAAAHRHLLAFPRHKVLIVAVEIPSLSFHPADASSDQLTAALVFGDGAGAAVLTGDSNSVGCLEVVDVASFLIPDTSDVLGFDLKDDGFHVVLHSRLHRVIRRELEPVVSRFLDARRFRPDFYVVHAAGPRIFNAVESALALPPHALDRSRDVFSEVGNASSAAIFFAIEKEMNESPAHKMDGLGIGLGPGVSVELMQLSRAPVAPARRSFSNAERGMPARIPSV